MSRLDINKCEFEIDGKAIKLYSGAMHYFRIPAEYWHDRLLKLKLAGFNTVETYCAWNMHESVKGKFNFEGMADVAKFVKTAEEVGLYAIVRPGPYICAEWNFGGFPAWLMKDKNLRLRCNNEPFLAHVKSYYEALMKQLKPHLSTNGGNIIAMQVENEYGSYGNDKQYLNAIRKIMDDCGVDVFQFTSDGTNDSMLYSGTIEGVTPTVNFGSNVSGAMRALRKFNGQIPKMCMEFWCGWFDHFGEKHHTRGTTSTLREIKSFISNEASFNVYMFHGGTNFGFGAGANHTAFLQPTVTSYDYCAPIGEYGNYTPQYHAIREYLCGVQGIELTELPAAPELQSIGEVKLNVTASLWDNFDTIGTTRYSAQPETMEHFDQANGLIYYKTKVAGNREATTLSLEELRDRAYIYVNGNLKAKFEAPLVAKQNNIFKRKKVINTCRIARFKNGLDIGVLVDALGRVNYGPLVGKDRKGITGVRLGNMYVMDFEVTSFPLDNIDKVNYIGTNNKYPLFMKGSFTTTSRADCFVDMTGFTKGYVYVNGHNLGRYWNVGPQKTLYIPGVWLNDYNEIVVLELEGAKKMVVNITDKHVL